MLAPVIAWIFLDEPLTPLMIAGAVLVFTAMAAVVIRATRRVRTLVEAELPPP
jgi:drug/metabolite transporter (DMT)-like permease